MQLEHVDRGIQARDGSLRLVGRRPQVGLGLAQRELRAFDAGLGLGDVGLEVGGVGHGQDLAGGDVIADLDEHLSTVQVVLEVALVAPSRLGSEPKLSQ